MNNKLKLILGLFFFITFALFAGVLDSNLKKISTDVLWQRFFKSILQQDNQTSYKTMRELCERDIAYSESDKSARWIQCSSTNQEICRKLNTCKPIQKNRLNCKGGAATNEDALFLLWMNCNTVLTKNPNIVRFSEFDASSKVDFTGQVYLIEK